MYLTDEGRRMYGLILPEMVKIHADIVSILSDEELALFDGLLAKLQAHAVTLEQQDRYADLPRIGRSRPPR